MITSGILGQPWTIDWCGCHGGQIRLCASDIPASLALIPYVKLDLVSRTYYISASHAGSRHGLPAEGGGLYHGRTGHFQDYSPAARFSHGSGSGGALAHGSVADLSRRACSVLPPHRPLALSAGSSPA